MPLLGKVPWELDSIPSVIPISSEFWAIRFTGELFSKYEDYLKRIELYRDRVWTCKITEKSGLTFEEAALSEKRSSQKAESFPEVYLPTFLNIVHLNTSTLGDLVDEVYNFYKENYVEGEQIECQAADSKEWKIGKIKEIIKNKDKTNGNSRLSSKGENEYKVELEDGDIVDVSHSCIKRKRFAVTKEMLKQKIKQVASRDRYTSAPWLVDIGLCRRYSLASYDGMSTVSDGDESGEEGDRPNKRQKTYPMEDLEREGNEKLPPPSTDFTVPSESMGDLLSAWHFMSSFTKGLQLSPFSLDDLESALAHPGELELTNEIHYRLLRVAFNQKNGGSLPKKDINGDTWCDVLQIYLEKLTGEKKQQQKADDMSDTSSQNTNEDSSDSEKEEEQPTTTTDNPEDIKKLYFKKILENMKKDSWYDLEPADKISIIKQLCDVALQTEVIRHQVDDLIEASNELSKEMKEQDLVDKKRKKEIEKERAKATKTKSKSAKNGTSAKGNGKDPNKEEASREALKLARREEAMDKNNIRLISIGQDRFHNRYWYWSALYGRLFIERSATSSSSSSSSSSKSTTSTSWGYYSTKGELDSLLEFLDERGVREIVLKAAIEKKYNKMITAMDKRSNEMATAATVTEVRRSSRIKTTTTRVDTALPPFMNYVNKFT